MTPALEAQGLVKRFGALAATDEVSLSVAPGRIHALIGPNGAGKTTLIAQLSGALRPDAGRIRLGGRDVTALAAPARAALGLARTFQVTALFEAMTVGQTVSLAARAKRRGGWLRRVGGDAGVERAAAEAIAEVGLAGREDVAAAALSHGERRALELAMALAQRPRLLLLDEPLAGTGREEAARLVALIASLRGRVATLLVEHDMEAVFAVADVVSVLVAGRVIAHGPPEAVRADPAVQAAYLGETA